MRMRMGFLLNFHRKKKKIMATFTTSSAVRIPKAYYSHPQQRQNNISNSGHVYQADFETCTYILQECIKQKDLARGQKAHAHLMKTKFQHEICLNKKLVIMYGKLGSLKDARKVFDKMPERDVVAWTAMIAGYMQHDRHEDALELFYQMQRAFVEPNEFTFTTVLAACARSSAMESGRQVHSYVAKTEFQSDLYVCSALLDMYAKCGKVHDARRVFDKMPQQDVVSCTAIIAGYAQQGYSEEALKLFGQLQELNMDPSEATFASVLSALADIVALDCGKQAHGGIVRRGLQSHVILGNALVNMYCKCGSLETARNVFDKMSQRNIISWNVMITGYGRHGFGRDCIRLFEEMQLIGMRPDGLTLLALLSGCSRGGLVTEGWHYFDSMNRKYRIVPAQDHFACMVDLLGRAGRLEDALTFIRKIPYEPDASIWGALLGACRIHVDFRIGKLAAEHLFELEPENPGNYVILSNIYAAASMWDEVVNVREIMKDKGIQKKSGCSWIEVNTMVHYFFWGDRYRGELCHVE